MFITASENPMVEQSICPNCGSEMDLSNLFISGKATCPKCGFKGNPVKSSAYVAKLKKAEAPVIAEKEEEPADPLDLRSLIGKIAIIFAIIFVVCLGTPQMRSLAPASFLGVLIFAIAYRIMEAKK